MFVFKYMLASVMGRLLNLQEENPESQSCVPYLWTDSTESLDGSWLIRVSSRKCKITFFLVLFFAFPNSEPFHTFPSVLLYVRVRICRFIVICWCCSCQNKVIQELGLWVLLLVTLLLSWEPKSQTGRISPLNVIRKPQDFCCQPCCVCSPFFCTFHLFSVFLKCASSFLSLMRIVTTSLWPLLLEICFTFTILCVLQDGVHVVMIVIIWFYLWDIQCLVFFFFFPFRVKTGTTRGSCIAAGMNQLQLVSLSCLLEIPFKGLERSWFYFQLWRQSFSTAVSIVPWTLNSSCLFTAKGGWEH